MKITTSGMRAAEQKLAAIAGAEARARMRAVNKVAAKARTEASVRIRAEVKLKASDINEPGRFVVVKATLDNQEATLKASQKALNLATYGARQLAQAVKNKARSKGNPKLGIPAGRKQAGLSVHVRRRTKLGKAFFLPGTQAAFIRTDAGKNDIKPIFGPSVAQVFGWIKPKLATDIMPELRQAYVAQLKYELGGIK